MMQQAVDVMTSRVSDDQAGRRHEQDRSGMTSAEGTSRGAQERAPKIQEV